MDMTWDLSIFYDSFDDQRIEQDFTKLNELIAKAKDMLASDMSTEEKLLAYVNIDEEMSVITERLGNFSGLTLATDAVNEAAAKVDDRLMQTFVELSTLNSETVRFIASIENLGEMIENNDTLKQVDFALYQMQEESKHLIPKEMEPWLLRMSLTGGNAFSQLRDKLDATLEVDYKCQKQPLSAIRAMAYDPDPAVRKSAYEAEIESYKKVEIPMAACLNSIKGEAQTMSEIRHFDSVLQMTLEQSNMDKETLDAMFTAIDEVLPEFRAYLKKKAEILGHKNGLPFYDLFAPIKAKGYKPKTYTVEEAKEKLVTEMGKFSPDMAKFIAHAFENRWIDMYPHAGKSGGAFCAEAHHEKQSRVLTNFVGSFSDVSTIAHELGHAWHNEQLKDLPYMMIDAPMPLAETASIFNETLLAHAARQQADEKEAFTLLEGDLMENTQVIVDIYSRFLFEKYVIETRKDHSLSVQELKDAMLDAQDKTYGDGLDPEYRHPYMWACKSHYYSAGYNFYNFPYAFGALFGKGVFAEYMKKGEAFVPEYNKLLSMCGSKKVRDVAAMVGIDVGSVDFWRSSLKVITDDIHEFIRLADKLTK